MFHIMVVHARERSQDSQLHEMILQAAAHCHFLVTESDMADAENNFTALSGDTILWIAADRINDGEVLCTSLRQRDISVQMIVIADSASDRKPLFQKGASDVLYRETLNVEELIRAFRCAQLRFEQARHIQQNYHQLAQTALIGFLQTIRAQGITTRSTNLTLPWECAYFDPYRSAFRFLYITCPNPLYQDASAYIRKLIQETMEHVAAYELLILDAQSAVLLLGEIKEVELATCCANWHRQSKLAFLPLCLTLSAPISTLTQMGERFQFLMQTHELHFYSGPGLIKQEEVTHGTFFHSLNKGKLDYHIRLIDALNARDYLEISHIHMELITHAKEAQICPKEVLSYVAFLLNLMEGNELKKGLKTNFDFNSILQRVQHCQTLNALELLMQDTIMKIAEWLSDEGSDRYDKEIAEIMMFIEQNCTEKINLHMLAERFNVNESYLSGMFKKQTGKNLTYFINEKKMTKARELLSDPNIMVKEAAFALGYEDQFYFYKLFKRFFGISPSEYRRRILEQKHTAVEA